MTSHLPTHSCLHIGCFCYPTQSLDRAQTQAADQVTVHLTHPADPANPSVTIKQNPTALKGSKVCGQGPEALESVACCMEREGSSLQDLL